MNVIRVGSRGSALALAQTRLVMALLEGEGAGCELRVYTSKGDLVRDRPIQAIGGEGVFVRELESALLAGEIDLAVHSMKDLPARQPEGLVLAPVPRREDPRDALVLRAGLTCLKDLPSGARVGTGSPRRAGQLLALRPDLEVVPIRGNLDTRLRRVETDLDGVVLAAAGLRRLGLEGRITQLFSPLEMLPAPAQGALALEVRAEDRELLSRLEAISHRESDLTVRAERAFLLGAGAGCHAPVGAWCRLEGEELVLTALYGEEGERRTLTRTARGDGKDPEELGRRLAAELVERYREEAVHG